MSQLRHILNRYRAESGMTLEQLAETSGVSRQTLLNLSAGLNYGDVKTWLRQWRALDVGLDDLLDGAWEAGARVST